MEYLFGNLKSDSVVQVSRFNDRAKHHDSRGRVLMTRSCDGLLRHLCDRKIARKGSDGPRFHLQELHVFQ